MTPPPYHDILLIIGAMMSINFKFKKDGTPTKAYKESQEYKRDQEKNSHREGSLGEDQESILI